MNEPKVEGHFVLFKSGTLHIYCCEDKTACGRATDDALIVPIAEPGSLHYTRICKKCDEIVG